MPGRTDGETAAWFEVEVAGITQSFVDGSSFFSEFNSVMASSCQADLGQPASATM
jgi:hypothetical protein